MVTSHLSVVPRTTFKFQFQFQFLFFSCVHFSHFVQGGIFTNKFWNGTFYRRISPTSFYSMMAKAPTDEQVGPDTHTQTHTHSGAGRRREGEVDGPCCDAMRCDAWCGCRADMMASYLPPSFMLAAVAHACCGRDLRPPGVLPLALFVPEISCACRPLSFVPHATAGERDGHQLAAVARSFLCRQERRFRGTILQT